VNASLEIEIPAFLQSDRWWFKIAAEKCRPRS
jgi:hypothetical protein